jgi:CRP-like cAMP-binding protein
VIESGRVEITAKHDERIEQLAELGPGGYFGEIAPLENQLRSATVTALEDTTLIVLTRWDFLAELKDLTLQPGFAFSGGDQSTRPERERPRLLRHRGWGEQ